MSEVYSSVGASSAEELTQAWANRVAANREQAERLREEADHGDHYRPLASTFRADPRRTGDVALEALLELASESDVWVDVGAGAGRFALPLALHVQRVIAVEPSRGMRAELAQMQLEYGVMNVEMREQRWPSDDPQISAMADVALIAHVAYDIEPIGEFLDTLERSATRECVAMLFDRSPGSLFGEVWPAVHGEELVHLPGADELVELLEARGAQVDAAEIVHGGERQRFVFGSVDEAMRGARRRLWLAEDSARMPALRDAVEELLIERDGSWSLPDQLKQMLIRWRTR